jgi:hypothetical protein
MSGTPPCLTDVPGVSGEVGLSLDVQAAASTTADASTNEEMMDRIDVPS